MKYWGRFLTPGCFSNNLFCFLVASAFPKLLLQCSVFIPESSINSFIALSSLLRLVWDLFVIIISLRILTLSIERTVLISSRFRPAYPDLKGNGNGPSVLPL